MKRSLIVLVAVLLPAAIFAQAQGQGQGRDPMRNVNGMLKGFGLTDDQIAQVQTIEKSAREAVRADFTHIRLVQAQIAEALLPANPDAQAINALIEKKGQFRVEIDKTLMTARIQLKGIMGNDNFAKYESALKERMRSRFEHRHPMGSLDDLNRPMMQGSPMQGEAPSEN